MLKSLDSFHEVAAAWDRLCRLMAEPNLHGYHFTERNCEHVARYITFGRRECLQLRDALILAAGMAFLFTSKAG